MLMAVLYSCTHIFYCTTGKYELQYAFVSLMFFFDVLKTGRFADYQKFYCFLK